MDMAVEESVGETEEKALKLIDTDVHNYLSGMDDLMYEYACHEGNEGMIGILAGGRAEEAVGAGGQ